MAKKTTTKAVTKTVTTKDTKKKVENVVDQPIEETPITEQSKEETILIEEPVEELAKESIEDALEKLEEAQDYNAKETVAELPQKNTPIGVNPYDIVQLKKKDNVKNNAKVKPLKFNGYYWNGAMSD